LKQIIFLRVRIKGKITAWYQEGKTMQRTTVFQAEVAEIQKYRWIQSEKAGYDIGQDRAAMEWIAKYAAKFREQWERKIQAEQGGVH